MNKENAHLYLPLVQALVDGNDVQQLSCGEWVVFDDYSFSQGAKAYRIKPKPAEVKAWVNKKTGKCDQSLGFSGLPLGTTESVHTVRLFREVL